MYNAKRRQELTSKAFKDLVYDQHPLGKWSIGSVTLGVVSKNGALTSVQDLTEGSFGVIFAEVFNGNDLFELAATIDVRETRQEAVENASR